MKILMAGGNLTIPTERITVTIRSDRTVDASAYRLYANGKVRGDSDMVFYGQLANEDQSISLNQQGNQAIFQLNLPQLHTEVNRIAFAITCNDGLTVEALQQLAITVSAGIGAIAEGQVDLAGRSEMALIMGEVYRRNSEWKFRFIAQGFNGGLQPLAEHFGIEITSPASNSINPASPNNSPANINKITNVPLTSPPVNLSKISLTKEKRSVSLEKRDDFGKIRINLNWHREIAKKGGFFNGLLSNKGVDLDLGAFVRLKNGECSVVQALGNGFGYFDRPPYVQLEADDRTGDNISGEWININGRYWGEIDEVLIYAFIYEGVPNWTHTDGVVTVYVPDQAPIETRLTEGDNNGRLCAIARLINQNGAIKVERLNEYFKRQRDMDQAYGWGFRWTAGRK